MDRTKYRLPNHAYFLPCDRYKIMKLCWLEDPNARPSFSELKKQLKKVENHHQVRFPKHERCPRGGSRIFVGGGALVSCSTSTPKNQIVFFCRIPIVVENCRSSHLPDFVFLHYKCRVTNLLQSVLNRLYLSAFFIFKSTCCNCDISLYLVFVHEVKI